MTTAQRNTKQKQFPCQTNGSLVSLVYPKPSFQEQKKRRKGMKRKNKEEQTKQQNKKKHTKPKKGGGVGGEATPTTQYRLEQVRTTPKTGISKTFFAY